MSHCAPEGMKLGAGNLWSDHADSELLPGTSRTDE